MFKKKRWQFIGIGSCMLINFCLTFATSFEITYAAKGGRMEPTRFQRLYIYTAVLANMVPSVAFVLLNTPNDFINDFNRYPESIPTVSIAQYNRNSSEGLKRSRVSESIAFANARISDEEMF